MDKEKLFRQLEQRYSSKRELLSRIPLGIHPDVLWQDLLNRRRAGGEILPLCSHSGMPYWYVTTDKMVSASEKIIEAAFENETEFDPYTNAPTVSTLEEVFFTGFVEGSQMTMQAAMDFLTSEQPPRDIEEQLIVNNRQAGNFATANLYRTIDTDFLQELAYILTDGMDNGGRDFRMTDDVDYYSPSGESYIFPSATLIPDRINELCAFLQLNNVHPLIKAAVAQAYILVIRPFPEGNERLSRILSSIILIRAGYTFFSDISLSALIAKRNYAYYEAVSNILSEENGGDLTYFVGYFLELLSRAVDERRMRIRQREEHARQTEKELAKTALTPSFSVPDTNETASFEEGGEGIDGFFTFIPTETLTEENDTTLARVRDLLYRHLGSDGAIIQKCAVLLLKFIDDGIYSFTAGDLEKGCNVSAYQAGNLITHLREENIIESGEWVNKRKTYRFNTNLPPLSPKDYADEIIDSVKKLQNSRKSARDKRVSEILLQCLPKGIITKADYINIEKVDKQKTDMLFAEQLGIVKKICNGVYRINRKMPNQLPSLGNGQKKIMTVLYNAFGEEGFTCDMARDATKLSGAHVSYTLHQFVLLQIIDCNKESPYIYRLRVNPKNNPDYFAKEMLSETERVSSKAVKEEKKIYHSDYSEEVLSLIQRLANSATSYKDRRLGENLQKCLDKGILLRSDYEEWGHTESIWNADISLAKQMGLISDAVDGGYLLNKELSSVKDELKPHQKRAITAIYEAFGDKHFSSEMIIATLNYSTSYTYASLHTLTLMRILDQKSTENGNRYQLLVNPDEHPEYFDIAA